MKELTKDEESFEDLKDALKKMEQELRQLKIVVDGHITDTKIHSQEDTWIDESLLN